MDGQLLGHFRVAGKIGSGGMGVVYRARDERLDRDVALKVLPEHAFHDQAARARLLREARTASRLNHPNICTIHEVGESDGQIYIAMELVDGRSLSDLVAGGPLGSADVLRLGIQLSEALAHAHERGVVHRDLKSANIVVTPEGRAKVLDFGLARRMGGGDPAQVETRTQDSLIWPGTVAGTLAYMSPEQLRGQPADERSDIWALGVVLFEMASGTRPFRGNTSFELSSAILNQPPPPLPPAAAGESFGQLGPIVERCLEKAPAQRYQRVGEVRAALEAVQSGTGVSARPPEPPVRHRRRRWVSSAGAAVALLAIAVVLDVGSVRSRWSARLGAPPVHAVAVLPVANLSGDPEQEYFSDGMTDALITDLSKIGALRVTSRTSVMHYKGAKKRLPEIARELGVDTVLEASVLREASRVRVTAQLLQASTERSLWTESYERDFSSVLSIQRDVAQAVARVVRVRLQPREAEELAVTREVDPATYEAYLKGMHLLNKATQADREKGVACFLQAVEHDAADPLAYAGLALAYTQLAHGSEARDDDLQRAKAAAATAIRLDDSLAEVVLASGFVKGYYEWKWEEAIADVRRAAEMNPSLAMAYYHLAWYQLLFGKIDEGIQLHQKAKQLDPFNPLHVAWLGELFRLNGQLEEAAAECQRSIEMAPTFPPGHFVLGKVYADRGMYPEAIASMQKAAEASPAYRWALGPVYVAAGRRDEAIRLVDELDRQKATPWVAFWRVVNHADLGNLDEAFRWLDYEPHHAWVAWIGALDWAKPLRRDPRFPAHLGRMNVPVPASVTAGRPDSRPRS
jgi:serine/threonine protein kinase/tetratricopeptide (TPR) repeat protein